MTDELPKNVLGSNLEACCTDPMTGYYRDGYCHTDKMDRGKHVICAVVTREFLEFSRQRGNNLMSPAPEYNFPGLQDGDSWCLCALRWKEALNAGLAPPVKLESTHKKALEFIDIEDLKAHSFKPVSGTHS